MIYNYKLVGATKDGWIQLGTIQSDDEGEIVNAMLSIATALEYLTHCYITEVRAESIDGATFFFSDVHDKTYQEHYNDPNQNP